MSDTENIKQTEHEKQFHEQLKIEPFNFFPGSHTIDENAAGLSMRMFFHFIIVLARQENINISPDILAHKILHANREEDEREIIRLARDFMRASHENINNSREAEIKAALYLSENWDNL